MNSALARNTVHGLMCGAVVMATPVSKARGQTLAGDDLLVGSRTHGSIYGGIRSPAGPYPLITGRDLSNTSLSVLGSGPLLANSAQLSIVALNPSRLFMRGAETAPLGLYSVDIMTGNRTLILGTDAGDWLEAGEMIAFDEDTIVAIADDWQAGAAGVGKVLKYSIASGITTVLTGGSRGDGVVMFRPRALALVNVNTIAVLEFGQGTSSPPLGGTVVYLVDTTTGNRSVLSTLGTVPVARHVVTDGVMSNQPINIPPRGAGPIFNGPGRGITFAGGRLIAAMNLTGPFAGALVDIDLASGDRSVMVGDGIVGASRITVQPGLGSTVALPSSPASVQKLSSSEIAFVSVFGPNRVWKFNIMNMQLSLVADLTMQIAQSIQSTTNFSALCVVPRSHSLSCYPNCDNSTTEPILNPLDFSCFLTRFRDGQSLPPAQQQTDYANCDGSTINPILNVLDFACFLNRYRAGCP